VKLDTFTLANFLLRSEKTLSLESLSKKYNILQESAHRALDDTIATKDLFMVLVKQINSLPQKDKEIISYIFSRSIEKEVKFLEEILDLPQGFDKENIIKDLLKSI
jgi:DNA polymerase III alpha subunit (gram-positive type)